MHYNSYHTSIKQLAKQYKLPEKYLRNIDRSTIWRWKNQVFNKCLTSPLQLCRRVYPNQLTKGEAQMIKEMLTDQEFKYWPINSIAYYALRKNLVNTSSPTWYNYAKQLGINRRRFSKKSIPFNGIYFKFIIHHSI